MDLGLERGAIGVTTNPFLANIALNTGDRTGIDIAMEVGEVQQTVTVSAEVVAVNTSSGEKSGSLGSEELQVLALRGRDIFDAVSLMPGVVDTSDGRDAPGPTSIGNIYIAGGRNDHCGSSA